jgi:NAD(P)-dependent dehydrogenase (short-subunit alcohol dehydrogenase family)
MKINVIVGCEGILGRQIVESKLSKSDNIVIGYDSLSSSTSHHDRFQFVSGNVESRADIMVLKDRIKKIQVEHNVEGKIDCIINSFAATDYKYMQKDVPIGLSDEDWMIWGWQNYPDGDFLKQYEVNVLGIHRILTVLYDCYRHSQDCSIVNFSSQFAKRNLDQELFMNLDSFTFKPPAYSASKAAIENYTEYLSQVFKKSGIRVNTIAPGVVDTGQSDVFKEKYSKETNTGRMMDAREIIGAIEFLTSELSSYMNGACLTLDGGWSTR